MTMTLASIKGSGEFDHEVHSANWEEEEQLALTKLKSILISTQKSHIPNATRVKQDLQLKMSKFNHSVSKFSSQHQNCDQVEEALKIKIAHNFNPNQFSIQSMSTSNSNHFNHNVNSSYHEPSIKNSLNSNQSTSTYGTPTPYVNFRLNMLRIPTP
jgi:hypothetical protein